MSKKKPAYFCIITKRQREFVSMPFGEQGRAVDYARKQKQQQPSITWQIVELHNGERRVVDNG